MLEHIFSLSTQESGASETLWVWGQPSLYSEFQMPQVCRVRLHFNNKGLKGKWWGGKIYVHVSACIAPTCPVLQEVLRLLLPWCSCQVGDFWWGPMLQMAETAKGLPGKWQSNPSPLTCFPSPIKISGISSFGVVLFAGEVRVLVFSNLIFMSQK